MALVMSEGAVKVKQMEAKTNLTDNQLTMDNQLTRAIAARASVDQTNWVVFSAFWGANALLLIALVQSAEIKPLVPIAGVVLSLVWVLIQRRALGQLGFLESVVEKLERALTIKPEHAVSGWINPTYEKYMPLPLWLRARHLMVLSGVMVAVFWAALLVAKVPHFV